MTQLHAVVAKQKALQERTRRALTDFYHKAQHAPMFMGGARELASLREDIPDEPPEITLPALTAQHVFQFVTTLLTDAWDVMATRDRSNMDAKADIVVDGATLARGVPVATLLSLETGLVDLRTFINGMPVRDPSKVWQVDPDQGFHRAPEVRKAKTRKVMKSLVLIEPTKDHPGKAEAYPSDEIVGHYVATDFSGAPSAQERQSLVDRLNKVIDAVRDARSEANQTEVTDFRLASELLGYVFTG